MLDLLLPDIKDQYIRENFRRLQLLNDENPLVKGQWALREFTFLAALTNEKIPHGLSFQPKDVILTSKTGAGSLTVNYDLIDRTNLDFTTTGPCVVRLLVGTLI